MRRIALCAKRNEEGTLATISLVMIARDEARCIERCLESARPWVDAMLVLDTGSTDDTRARAQCAGAQVHRFEWLDDFSAARNASLALSNTDWNLVLDADEWLVSGGETLAALHASAERFIGHLNVESSFDQSGAVQCSPSWLPRLLPRGVRYAGRVHEQPVHQLPRKRLPIVIGHDGYRGAQMTGKQGRNRRLLQLGLVDQPDDTYLRYQLGKDFEVHGEHAQAALHYEQAHLEAEPQSPWRHDLVLRLLFSLKKLRRFEEALHLAQGEMPRWPHSADFYFTLGDLLLDWAVAEPARAGELLPMIEASWQRCLELGDTLDLEGAVAGRGSTLAAHNLATFYGSLGRAAEAQRYRELEQELLSAINPTRGIEVTCAP